MIRIVAATNGWDVLLGLVALLQLIVLKALHSNRRDARRGAEAAESAAEQVRTKDEKRLAEYIEELAAASDEEHRKLRRADTDQRRQIRRVADRLRQHEAATSKAHKPKRRGR